MHPTPSPAFDYPACQLGLRLPLVAPAGLPSVLWLEQRSLNAWPAPQTAVMDSWALRACGGYTKRANSANAMQAGAVLDKYLLAQIEDFYARQELLCIFRLSPLADGPSDELLQAHGYQLADPSLFMQRAIGVPDAHWPAISVSEVFSQDWFDGCCQASGVSLENQTWHARILRSITGRCAYACVQQDGRPVAWGLAVLERNAVGIFDVVVDASRRGQGLGRTLIKGLQRWAAGQGARSMDLQVTGSNAVAQRLYASEGFEFVYGYHYRIKARDLLTHQS